MAPQRNTFSAVSVAMWCPNTEHLTHWGRVTHICISKLTILGLDNGLLPGRRQVIIWTNAGIFLIPTLGTNFSEILGEIHSFSFKKMHLKMSSAKGRLFSLSLNELRVLGHQQTECWLLTINLQSLCVHSFGAVFGMLPDNSQYHGCWCSDF